VRALRDRKVLVAAGALQSNLGRHGDHIQISPPFIISEKEIAGIVEAVDSALADVTKAAG
jgi:4-aminobutyrate aminotransferase-like enzyme